MSEIKLELDNMDCGAFNLYGSDGKKGTMMLSIDGRDMLVFHTETTLDSRGKGFGRRLFDKMADHAEKHGLGVNPLCPYVHAQFKKDPDKYRDIWKKPRIKM